MRQSIVPQGSVTIILVLLLGTYYKCLPLILQHNVPFPLETYLVDRQGRGGKQWHAAAVSNLNVAVRLHDGTGGRRSSIPGTINWPKHMLLHHMRGVGGSSLSKCVDA